MGGMMAVNPLARAIRQAERDNAALGVLFGRMLGSARHPRGQVRATYRQTRRALAGVLELAGPVRLLETNEVLTTHQRQLRTIALDAALQASRLGQGSAEAQYGFYAAARSGLPEPAGASADLRPLLEAMDAVLTAQLAQAQALISAGADPALVIGDDVRLGLLQAAPIARDWSGHLGLALRAGFAAHLVGGGPVAPWPFRRQAIAALDERTTDCCLRVHGQIVDLDGRFHLTGTPRFADDLKDPPFHWYCRTSVALYLPDYDADGDLSGAMRAAARTEIAARVDGTRVEIHPASATSRR